jgi:hypothetical protein
MAPTRSVQSVVASLRARVCHKPEMLALAPLRQRGRRLRQRRRPHPRPRHNDKARCCRLSSNPSLSCSREPVGDSCPRGIRWPRKVPSLAPRAAGRQGYLERQPPGGLRCRIPLCQRKECDAHRELYDDFGMLGTQPSENWRDERNERIRRCNYGGVRRPAVLAGQPPLKLANFLQNAGGGRSNGLAGWRWRATVPGHSKRRARRLCSMAPRRRNAVECARRRTFLLSRICSCSPRLARTARLPRRPVNSNSTNAWKSSRPHRQPSSG